MTHIYNCESWTKLSFQESENGERENCEEDGNHDEIGETLLMSCKCEKCFVAGDIQSFCCSQFPKIRNECNQNGELNLKNKTKIEKYDSFRREMCHRSSSRGENDG